MKNFFVLERTPEPEVMDEAGEVDAYSSAAGQKHLEKLDDTFVERALRLLKGKERGAALDIGAGPGQIDLKLAAKLPSWKIIGVDRSARMIERARSGLAAANKEPGSRVEFRVADGNGLGFLDGSFDFVFCNSVLHHFAEPKNLLAEMARLVKPSGALLLRDLRRPSRMAFSLHSRFHGRHYSGTMYRLFCDSLRAAYTPAEVERLLADSPLQGARVFTGGSLHLGFERPITPRE